MGRFNLTVCATPDCDSYTATRFCVDCDGARKVLVPNVVRCAHPGCINVMSGDVFCIEHRD
jgi:hypothetical protein